MADLKLLGVSNDESQLIELSRVEIKDGNELKMVIHFNTKDKDKLRIMHVGKSTEECINSDIGILPGKF